MTSSAQAPVRRRPGRGVSIWHMPSARFMTSWRPRQPGQAGCRPARWRGNFDCDPTMLAECWTTSRSAGSGEEEQGALLGDGRRFRRVAACLLDLYLGAFGDTARQLAGTGSRSRRVRPEPSTGNAMPRRSRIMVRRRSGRCRALIEQLGLNHHPRYRLRLGELARRACDPESRLRRLGHRGQSVDAQDRAPHHPGGERWHSACVSCTTMDRWPRRRCASSGTAGAGGDGLPGRQRDVRLAAAAARWPGCVGSGELFPGAAACRLGLLRPSRTAFRPAGTG